MADSTPSKLSDFDFEKEMSSLIRGAVSDRLANNEQQRPEIAALNRIIDARPSAGSPEGKADTSPPEEAPPAPPAEPGHLRALFRLGAIEGEEGDLDATEDAALMQAKSRISFLEEENARAVRDLEVLRQSLNQAHAENETIAHALNAARGKNKRDAADAEQRLGESVAALNAAQTQVSRKEDAIKAINHQLDELKTALANAKTRITEKDGLIETSEIHLKELKSALSAAQTKIGEKKGLIETANLHHEHTKATLADAETRIADLDARVLSSQLEIDALSARIKDLEEENAALTQEINDTDDRRKRVDELLESNNGLLERARNAGYELVNARGVIEAARRICALRMLRDGGAVVAPSALQALFGAIGLYDKGRDANFVLDDVHAEIETSRERASRAEHDVTEALLLLEDAERRAIEAETRVADRFAHRDFERKTSIRELQQLCNNTSALLAKMHAWQPYAETLERDANAAMADELQSLRHKIVILQDIKTRADALATEVSAGLDSNHGLIKRAWLRFMTGRDEPVEEKSFAELHEIIAQSDKDC